MPRGGFQPTTARACTCSPRPASCDKGTLSAVCAYGRPVHVDHRLYAAAVDRVVEQLGFAVAARLATARILIEPLAPDVVADGEIESVAGAHAQCPVLAVILRPAVVVVALAVAVPILEALPAVAEIEGRRRDALGAARGAPAEQLLEEAFGAGWFKARESATAAPSMSRTGSRKTHRHSDART